MSILWIVIIGFVAGLIARWISPGSNEPSGFVLTTVLGIVGAFVVTWLGQLLGWYRPDQGAGITGAIVGALIVLFVWNRLVAARVVPDPWSKPRRPAATTRVNSKAPANAGGQTRSPLHASSEHL